MASRGMNGKYNRSSADDDDGDDSISFPTEATQIDAKRMLPRDIRKPNEA